MPDEVTKEFLDDQIANKREFLAKLQDLRTKVAARERLARRQLDQWFEWFPANKTTFHQRDLSSDDVVRVINRTKAILFDLMAVRQIKESASE